ncbi:MAG TPA: hypothetical protein VJ952_08735 [Opitutales bacterium]|nr:hypothetical protein [Opitutales bacterium]
MNYKLAYSFTHIMSGLRTSNRYLAAKSSGQISDQLKVRVYDSSVFEGVRLRKNHALVALAKASRKKAAKAV